MTSILRKSQMIGILLVGVLAFSSACSHRHVLQVGSHKVTVTRHGVEKAFHLGHQADVASFDFDSVSPTGSSFTVAIRGDNIKINGVDGLLHKGDSVLITDDGIAINSMDYGDSERYLRANTSSSEKSISN